jgi:uncharacterized protein
MKKYRPLIKLARDSILFSLKNEKLIIDDSIKKEFSEKKACFVTLTINEELRGCIGSLSASKELYKDVINNSKSAAFNDYRFTPVSIDELAKIKIEISILSEPVRLGIGKDVFNKIDKKMGIILRKGDYGSTFLPQVWEQVSDKLEFLEHLSRKAGLDMDSWKESELFFYRVDSVKEE